MDEWGQMAALAILTPYARSQFLDPSPEAVAARDAKKKADAAALANAAPGETDAAGAAKKPNENVATDDDDELQLNVDTGELDPDHRLLLRSTLPLLQSRSSAVVFDVIALYVAVAPPSELRVIGKALCRLVKGSREVQVKTMASASLFCCIFDKQNNYKTSRNLVVASTDELCFDCVIASRSLTTGNGCYSGAHAAR